MAKDIGALPGDLKRKADSIEKSMANKYKVATKRAAEAAVKRQSRVIESHSGGDSKLSGVNKAKGRAGNAKVGAKFRMLPSGDGGASAEVRATGPLQIIDRDTSGHVIRSAYSNIQTSTRRRGSLRGFIGPVLPGQTTGGRQAVIHIPGVGFRRSARHPGTNGKDTWRKGRDGALDDAGKTIGHEIDEAFRKGARG